MSWWVCPLDPRHVFYQRWAAQQTRLANLDPQQCSPMPMWRHRKNGKQRRKALSDLETL